MDMVYGLLYSQIHPKNQLPRSDGDNKAKHKTMNTTRGEEVDQVVLPAPVADYAQQRAGLVQPHVNYTQCPVWGSLQGDRPARVLRVLDGDTLEAVVHIDGAYRRLQLRLAGLNCPELKPSKNDPSRLEQIVYAHEARDALHGMIFRFSASFREPSNGLVRARVYGTDKFGRFLCRLWIDDAQDPLRHGTDLNQWLLTNGYAIPWVEFEQIRRRIPSCGSTWPAFRDALNEKRLFATHMSRPPLPPTPPPRAAMPAASHRHHRRRRHRSHRTASRRLSSSL